MTSMPSDTESNVSGFIHYSDKNFKHLYTSMIQLPNKFNFDLTSFHIDPAEDCSAEHLDCAPGDRTGNWVEDRIECPKGDTYYFPPKEDIDYEKMKPQSRQPDFRLNKLTSLQGSVSAVIRHDCHEACSNYATTNDLVYHHLPKPLLGPDQRHYRKGLHQWHPQPDLMKCFGNATEWGLRAYKQYEWACTDVSDYASSLYGDTYVPPRPDQYLSPCERQARNSNFTKSFRYKMTKEKQKKLQKR